MIKIYSKEELIFQIRQISEKWWHKSVKETVNVRNDGAVGNTLETLLGINENNLPIPNTREWELKGQRAHSKSLITLKHVEPSPTAIEIVTKLLLPYYGWKHQQAGKKYPKTEMSFRSTTYANKFTARGFKLLVDRKEKKLKFIFDAENVNTEKPLIKAWLNSVEKRIGLSSLNPEPYWGFEDLEHILGAKLKNCFYVVAESKKENNHEYFQYKDLYLLYGFSFGKFLDCLEKGGAVVDFDARTGHNHGTKFRLQQNTWIDIYSKVEKVL